MHWPSVRQGRKWFFLRACLIIGVVEKGFRAEEGAVQLFRPITGREAILGAVGVLQFEVTMARLKAEYGVDAVYENVDFATARWIGCEDRERMAAFVKANQANLARDAEGDLAYLAPTEWRLKVTMEEWPELAFEKTCEHG